MNSDFDKSELACRTLEQVTLDGLISVRYPIESAVEAFSVSDRPDTLKVLIAMDQQIA